MFIIRRYSVNARTGQTCFEPEMGMYSKEAVDELVRRGKAQIVREVPDPPLSDEPPGGYPPPQLLARLRAEGKIPPEPTAELQLVEHAPEAPVPELPRKASKNRK